MRYRTLLFLAALIISMGLGSCTHYGKPLTGETSETLETESNSTWIDLPSIQNARQLGGIIKALLKKNMEA